MAWYNIFTENMVCIWYKENCFQKLNYIRQITELLKWRGTSWGHIVNHPCVQVKASWILNIFKCGNSTTCLGNLFCCLTLTVKGYFPMFRWSFVSFMSYFPLSWQWTPIRWVWLPFMPPVRHWWDSPLNFLSFRMSSPSLLSHSSHERCFNPPVILVALLWICSYSSMSFLYWGNTEHNTPDVMRDWWCIFSSNSKWKITS